MKKIVSILLSFALIVCTFAACSLQKEEVAPQKEGSNATGKRYKVAIVQKNDASNTAKMREAFITGIRDLGYDEAQMSFDIRNAQNNAETLKTICEGLKNKEYDLIVPIGDEATLAVTEEKLGAKIVFVGVKNPVELGIVKTMEAPSKTITGTIAAVPEGKIFEYTKSLLPRAKTIGLLYMVGNEQSAAKIENIKAYLTEQKFVIEEKAVADVAEIADAAKELSAKVKAVYIPEDAALEEALPQILEATTAKRIPVLAESRNAVSLGAFAYATVNSEELGHGAAELADQILKDEEVVMTAPNLYCCVINTTTAKTLGISLENRIDFELMG